MLILFVNGQFVYLLNGLC